MPPPPAEARWTRRRARQGPVKAAGAGALGRENRIQSDMQRQRYGTLEAGREGEHIVAIASHLAALGNDHLQLRPIVGAGGDALDLTHDEEPVHELAWTGTPA